MDALLATRPGESVISRRVDYSETDQMGVVYHARYLVWFDVARTEYLRSAGLSYRELESRGFRLVVSDLQARYRRPARYDDPIRVRIWVRSRESRRVIFGYAVEHEETGELLVTGSTAMVVLDSAFRPTRLPDDVAALLLPIPDPVRL
jgi:acyl-CoA thioester hydrolase